MNNIDIPPDLIEIRDDALEIAASLYRCARTNCACGKGKMALDKASEELQVVRDLATARAYCEGLIFMAYRAADLLSQLSGPMRIFVSLVLCEAMRVGGILTEEQIDSAVAKLAATEADATAVRASQNSDRLAADLFAAQTGFGTRKGRDC